MEQEIHHLAAFPNYAINILNHTNKKFMDEFIIPLHYFDHRMKQQWYQIDELRNECEITSSFF